MWAALASAAVILLAITLARRGEKSTDVTTSAPSKVAGNTTREIVVATPVAGSLPVIVDRASLQVDRMLRDKLVLEQWAYLEHDARVLAYAVTGNSLRAFLHPAALLHEPERQ